MTPLFFSKMHCRLFIFRNKKIYNFTKNDMFRFSALSSKTLITSAKRLMVQGSWLLVHGHGSARGLERDQGSVADWRPGLRPGPCAPFLAMSHEYRPKQGRFSYRKYRDIGKNIVLGVWGGLGVIFAVNIIKRIAGKLV